MVTHTWRDKVSALLETRRTLGRWLELTLRLDSPMRVEPGQFVHVACEGNRILRRPFSVFGVEDGGRFIRLLVKPRGGGSSWLAERKEGELIDLMGPLGRGFPLIKGKIAMVAGGIGIAPLALLGERLKEEGSQVFLFWGLPEPGEAGGLPLELGRKFEVQLAVERQDSSGDSKNGFTPAFIGTVMELFRSHGGSFDAVYACGPRAMYLDWIRKGAKDPERPVYLSWEERMACGVGACLGCVVPIRRGGRAYARACREGPVFSMEEIDWERVSSFGP